MKNMSLNKIKSYFLFRLIHIIRLINNDIDKLFIYVVFWGIIYFYNFNNDWLNLISYILPPLYYHINRSDIYFLKKTFGRKHFFILIIEYLFLSLITYSLISEASKNSIVPYINFLLCFIYPLITPKKIEWTKRIPLDFIPKEAYEWKTYIRNKPITFIGTYVLLLVSSYHPFTLGVMTFMFCGNINAIYSTIEPKEIYCMYFSYNTIESKLSKSISFIIKMILPAFTICFLINHTLFYITVIILSYIIMFSINAILTKYANYRLIYKENRPPNIMQIVEIMISIILIFPWIVNYYQLKKNVLENVNRYVRG